MDELGRKCSGTQAGETTPGRVWGRKVGSQEQSRALWGRVRPRDMGGADRSFARAMFERT